MHPDCVLQNLTTLHPLVDSRIPRTGWLCVGARGGGLVEDMAPPEHQRVQGVCLPES